MGRLLRKMRDISTKGCSKIRDLHVKYYVGVFPALLEN